MSCSCTPNLIRAHRKKFSVDKNIIWVIEGTDYIKISCELRVSVIFVPLIDCVAAYAHGLFLFFRGL